MTLAVPEINQPSMTVKELVTFIQQLEMNQERTLQTSIGPSEIGLPCSRRLIKKLLNTKDPQQDSRWLATVGTAVHAWLAQGFEAPEHRRGYLNGRFGDVLVEERVNVGTIGGVEIWGSADLFDILTGLVVDWKVVGNSRLDAYRRYGPGQQYRVQAHLYGRGFARLGLPVRNVLIMFLPRNKALNNFHAWTEPYDESVALAALSRADALLEIGRQNPWEVVEAIFPACLDEWCPWCPSRRPFGTPREVPTTMRAAIAAR